MNYKTKKTIYIFILLILVGCKRQPHYQNTIKKKDLAPKSLKELSKEIGSVMDHVANIEKATLGIDLKAIEKKNKKQEENQENMNQDKAEEESGKKDGQKDGQTDGNQSAQESPEQKNKVEDKLTKEEIKNQKIEDEWSKVDKELEKIYPLWNEYGVEGLKKGATDENAREVEGSLNKFIKGIEDRDVFIVYNYGSKSYKALVPYYNLYKDDVGGDVSSLKHILYQYYINTIEGSKSTAEMYTAASEEYINKIRLKWEDEKVKKEDLDEITFAFRNLSNSLEEDNRRMALLKRDALIKNLNSLEN